MLTILMGKSAVGKDTVQKELMTNADFERVVTATTRFMREGEQDGVDYHFMSDEQFKEDAANDKFIEYTEFNGVSYGSPKSSVDLEKDMCIDRLMGQLLLPKDAESAAKTLEMADMLLDKCGLHLIRCNPTPDAARVAYRAILGEEL